GGGVPLCPVERGAPAPRLAWLFPLPRDVHPHVGGLVEVARQGGPAFLRAGQVVQPQARRRDAVAADLLAAPLARRRLGHQDDLVAEAAALVAALDALQAPGLVNGPQAAVARLG